MTGVARPQESEAKRQVDVLADVPEDKNRVFGDVHVHEHVHVGNVTCGY